MTAGDGDSRSLRREYGAGGTGDAPDAAELRRASLPADPYTQFSLWFNTAVSSGAKDASAMALATVGAGSKPSVRIVLLKHYSEDGFCWYTDYRSRKGVELAANPLASAVFYWRDFDRQVRITGTVSRVDPDTSRLYFESRPIDSRFSAAASQQSSKVADRATLEARVAALRSRYPEGDVPKPDDWGGFCLRPSSIEFWQGREGRLHDRFLYTKTDSTWLIERLQP